MVHQLLLTESQTGIVKMANYVVFYHQYENSTCSGIGEQLIQTIRSLLLLQPQTTSTHNLPTILSNTIGKTLPSEACRNGRNFPLIKKNDLCQNVMTCGRIS